MTKIIDFSNGDNKAKVLIVNPNFHITGRPVSLEFKDGLIPTFKISVGCQNSNVTAENVDRIISELNGEERPSIPTDVIVPSGKNPKVASPKLLEKVGGWFISKDQKAFPEGAFEVKEIIIKEKRKYFTINIRGWNNEQYPMIFRGGHSLSKQDIDNIHSMLFKIKNYFEGK